MSFESPQAQLSQATQRAEALSAELDASHDEARRTQQEADEQVAELQQQLQQQLLAAGSLTERVLHAEQSSAQVSIPACITPVTSKMSSV